MKQYPAPYQKEFSEWLGKYVMPEQQTAMWEFADKVWNEDARPTGKLLRFPEGVSPQHCNDAIELLRAIMERNPQANSVANNLSWMEPQPVTATAATPERGSRSNSGKTRLDLLDWEALEGLADILTFGAGKYNDHNWRKGLPFTEQVASLLRHTAAFMRGEDLDPETGKPHVDHMQCNTMFLAWTVRNRKDMDDRWKPPVAVDKS